MMPTAMSRPRSWSPRNPMPMPPATVKASKPQSGGTPRSTAPVAPANPTWESAWPAKARLRSTRKYPTAPATIATTVPASKAVRMKSYSSIVAMRLRLDLAVGRHHHDAAVEPQHLDGRVVEPREHFGGDHLLGPPERGAAVPQIEHAIHESQQRIELVRGEQHGDAERALYPLDQLDHRLLITGVEAHQGLV